MMNAGGWGRRGRLKGQREGADLVKGLVTHLLELSDECSLAAAVAAFER